LLQTKLFYELRNHTTSERKGESVNEWTKKEARKYTKAAPSRTPASGRLQKGLLSSP